MPMLLAPLLPLEERLTLISKEPICGIWQIRTHAGWLLTKCSMKVQQQICFLHPFRDHQEPVPLGQMDATSQSIGRSEKEHHDVCMIGIELKSVRSAHLQLHLSNLCLLTHDVQQSVHLQGTYTHCL